jgi:hypothetical protein
MSPILDKLEGGDRRSIGRSNEVVSDVLADPRLFETVFSGMSSGDPLVRMRSADAVEKITLRHPEFLRPYKARLIGQLARIDEKEVRWHVAQMLPRVEWSARERRKVFHVLEACLNDRSSIVRTCAMQAIADLAGQAPELLPAALVHLRKLTAIGTPAMKARGRKLLAALSRPAGPQAENRP